MLEKYSHFLSWKYDSFNLLKCVKQLITIGGHHTFRGLNLLINKIYNSNHERFTDKKVWDERLKIWLYAKNNRRLHGHYYIYPLYTLNKDIRGWQVRFASSLKLPAKSNKAFMCST